MSTVAEIETSHFDIKLPSLIPNLRREASEIPVEWSILGQELEIGKYVVLHLHERRKKM